MAEYDTDLPIFEDESHIMPLTEERRKEAKKAAEDAAAKLIKELENEHLFRVHHPEETVDIKIGFYLSRRGSKNRVQYDVVWPGAQKVTSAVSEPTDTIKTHKK